MITNLKKDNAFFAKSVQYLINNDLCGLIKHFPSFFTYVTPTVNFTSNEASGSFTHKIVQYGKIDSISALAGAAFSNFI